MKTIFDFGGYIAHGSVLESTGFEDQNLLYFSTLGFNT